MTASEQQQLGALRAEVANLKSEMAEVKETLREVRDALISARGGYRFLIAVGTVVGAVIGVGLQFLPLFHKG